MQEFKLTQEYIELIKLLKITGMADSGAQAKQLVVSKRVIVNGQIEERKRAKLKLGDVVKINDSTIKLIE